MNVGEMFAGIGGFRLGLERANNSAYKQISEVNATQRSASVTERCKSQLSTNSFRIVWANEWDKHASQIYRNHWNDNTLQEGDIHKVNAQDIPDFDLLCGGFPCQPHSLAGKRKGFGDERGTVFHEIVRVADAKRPRLLLLENVKGLLSSEEGRAFGTVLEELGNIGYWCEWQVLNSKHYGVPQNRERVFIIGHLREARGCTGQVFPIGEVNQGVDGSCREAQGEGARVRDANSLCAYGGSKSHAYNLITANSERIGGSFGERNLIANTLSHRYGKDGSENLLKIGEVWEGSQCRVYDPAGIAPTVHKSGGNTEPMVLLDNLGGNIKHRVKDSSDNPAWTIGGSQTGVMSNQRIRRLTPVECERLQGFPDGWTSGVSDTQRYKTLGNAVTVNVIEYLGRLILASFDDKTTK